MKYQFDKKQLGVTLVEILLVTAVIGMMFVMYIGYTKQRTRELSINRASQQMQQVLNGALSYYLVNAAWPANLAAMQAPTAYVPTPFTSPWGTAYTAIPVPPVAPSTRSVLFQVTVTLPLGYASASAIGAVLAGKLPAGTSTNGPLGTSISATVNLPGQNVNNATAVNFAGLYKNGACVPEPSCPADGSGNPMKSEVIITPVSLSGANDPGTTNAYPITSFTAYASGPPVASPANCTGAATSPNCVLTGGTSPTGRFWRACVRVVTSKGTVDWSSQLSTMAPVMMAMTRCIIQNEASGSPFIVFGP
jgi:type II secretory pathway pseudopilin PulG